MKCLTVEEKKQLQESPSMRREWIEISSTIRIKISDCVSLHAEGVD